MKIFIWHDVAFITTRYFSGGTVVIVAKTLVIARTMMKDYYLSCIEEECGDLCEGGECRVCDDYKELIKYSSVKFTKPSRSYRITENATPEIFFQQDAAGC